MILQGIITPDDEIKNANYVGKTFAGLYAFWSRELSSDTALVFDSTAGITITREMEPQFDFGREGFNLIVYGSLSLNPIVKNTQAVIVLKDIERTISGGTDPRIIIPVGRAERFLDDIRTAVQESPLEGMFKEIALYDLEQARRAYGSRAFKACVIMLGAVLEGLMLGTLRRPDALDFIRNDSDLPGRISRSLGGLNRPEYSDNTTLADAIADRLSFDEYRLLVCRYIPDIERLQVEGIQSFRNAVHPWKAVQVPAVYADYDEARAMHHLSSLSILARHILSWTP